MEGLTKDLECLHCNDFYECKGKPKDTGICIRYNQREDYQAPKSEQVVFKPKRLEDTTYEARIRAEAIDELYKADIEDMSRASYAIAERFLTSEVEKKWKMLIEG